MLKEFVQYLVGLDKPEIHTVENLEYTNRPLTLILPPTKGCFPCSTLQALADILGANVDSVKSGDVVAHIISPTEVTLVDADCDAWGRRHTYAVATYPDGLTKFPFGSWLNAEDFIIKVQSSFQRVAVENDDGTLAQDLDYVLKCASDIRAEATATNKDDGVAQRVAVQSGVTLLSETVLKPRVNLAPYRTFAEIDQVLSLFIFRAKFEGSIVKLALFEADGGRWRLAATAAIKTWLENKLGGMSIIS